MRAPASEWRGGPWRCDGERCEQRYPRLPDDGQWECVDLDGVVICRGGGAPAGVAIGPPNGDFRCGARRGAPSERLCVDARPSFPDDGGWRCVFEHRGGERRVCLRDRAATRKRAPEGVPECWIDGDCSTKCREAKCVP